MASSEGLVRVGVVSAVDTEKHRAQVYYPDMNNMVSDWLSVLQSPGLTISTNGAGSHNHNGHTNNDGGHSHSGSVSGWMPNVNDRVLVLYLHGWNTDGFILGAIP